MCISKDGYKWEKYPSQLVSKVIWTDYGYIGCSSTSLPGVGVLSYSHDGIDWYGKRDGKYYCANNILFNGENIVLGTYDGRILTHKLYNNAP